MLLAQGLVACREIADKETMSEALVGLAAIHLEHDLDRAHRLWDLAAGLRARLESPPLAHVRPAHALAERALAAHGLDTAARIGALDERTVDEALSALIGEPRHL